MRQRLLARISVMVTLRSRIEDATRSEIVVLDESRSAFDIMRWKLRSNAAFAPVLSPIYVTWS